MMLPARFLRAIGIVAFVIGLSGLLILTTNRLYSLSGAKSVQDAQASGIYDLPDQMVSPSLDSSEAEPSRPFVTRKEISDLDAQLFSAALSDPSSASEIAPRSSIPDHSKPSSALPSVSINAVIRLVIPELKLDVPVRYFPFEGNTWDLNDLGQSVAWLGKMSGGETTQNLVLAGHITVRDGTHGPFRYLSRLKPGANLSVYTDQYIYTYQVRELIIVKPEETNLTGETANSQLTLLTCATWNEETKSYLRRQVVIADLLKVEPYLQGSVN